MNTGSTVLMTSELSQPSFSEDAPSLKESNKSAMSTEVAHFLLEHKFYLSALEYHFEQMERGRTIPKLHAFFSDPLFVKNLVSSGANNSNSTDPCRFGSMSTLDSFDFAGVSEDGNPLDEKLKVMEYELRTKNEELEQLRKELATLSTLTCFGPKGTKPGSHPLQSSNDTAPPHPFESRAMKFLIHEYLLKSNCRLTAVQFAEECESSGVEDVESWDQVGINLPKPPDLLILLRHYWSGYSSSHSTQLPCVASTETNRESQPGGNPFDDEDEASDNEMVKHDDDVDDGELQTRLVEIASLQARVIMFETKNAQLEAQLQQLRNQLICLEREHAEVVGRPLNRSLTAEDTSYSGDHSREINSIEWTADGSRHPSDEFLEHMTNPLPSTMGNDPFHLAASVEDLVLVLADRLEALLPQLKDDHKITILPLLTQSICLHPDCNARDRLLRQLFNLFSTTCSSDPPSSPTGDATRHRMIILNECRRLASYMGPTRIESELIPQLWSQLNHRPPPSDAQRLLLVSACGVIAPSVPPQLRSSLMLSILESNLDEERNESVRAAGIRSLAALVTLMSDWDKLPSLIQRLNQLLSVDASVSATTWLLPALAEWCLELDSLHTTLIDSWLDRLDRYILQVQSGSEPSACDSLVQTFGVLTHLVPFIHSWLLITMIKPAQPEQTYWLSAKRWALEQSCNGTGSIKSVQNANPISDSMTCPGVILGHRVYQQLHQRFSRELERDFDLAERWTARSWLLNIFLPKIIDILSNVPSIQTGIPPCTGFVYADNDAFDLFVSKQYDPHFAYPWAQPADVECTVVCLAVCGFLSTLGASLGEHGVDKLLAGPFRDALMKKNELGNFEYDQRAMQTGLLAAYCVLLASAKSKSQTTKLRMLLTNAVFLHVRESYPLETIRLAIWCLCSHEDKEFTVLELILPALRPCVCCADGVVRRAAATLLHTLIESLRHADRPVLMEPIAHLVGQLARDDVTGERQFINRDEADWSVLTLTLGPLYSLLQYHRSVLGRQLRTGDSCNEVSAKGNDGDFEERLYELLKLQCDLVVNRSDSNPFHAEDTAASLDGAEIAELTQRHCWPCLTTALLTITDRILPSCPSGFRDSVLLPWLCRLAELSNSLPSLAQRTRLADHLFVVFSTASYSVQLEESMFKWLVPGLSRVRLDLTEAGDTARTLEVEQFLNDLYARMRPDEADLNKPKESTPRRSTMSSTLAKLANRGNTPAAGAYRNGRPKSEQAPRTSRLSLKKR